MHEISTCFGRCFFNARKELIRLSYGGYLIDIGGYRFNRVIKADSYKVVMNSQDLDSYRDANGRLQRNALSHNPIKVEFETRAMLTNSEFASIMSKIRGSYINSVEKALNATFYVPELDNYVTQKVYMADITPQIYGTYRGVIHYDPIRFAFIGY